VALWGAPPNEATRFSLNRQLPGGATAKIGLQGQDGIRRYDFPLSVLSVEWIRDHWGSGRYQANWLVDYQGKRVPRGRSRVVELDDVVHARARGAVPVSIGIARENGASSPPPPPAQQIPPELIDARVRFAEEMAQLRIRTERELHEQRIAWERERADERFSRLEGQLERLENRRDRDDDDEPDEWAWLKDLGQQFAPTLKELVPVLLAKLGNGKQLPGGG